MNEPLRNFSFKMGCKDQQNWVRRIQTRGRCDLDLCQSPHRNTSRRQSVDAEWDFRFCTGLKLPPLCVHTAPQSARMCLMWRLAANRVFLHPPIRPSWHFSFNLLPLFQEIRRAVTWNLFEELGCCGGYAYRRGSVSYSTLRFCAFSPATLPLPTWVPSVLIPLTLS